MTDLSSSDCMTSFNLALVIRCCFCSAEEGAAWRPPLTRLCSKMLRKFCNEELFFKSRCSRAAPLPGTNNVLTCSQEMKKRTVRQSARDEKKIIPMNCENH
jgi:hypothetical protein